jgi:hypothetical protein
VREREREEEEEVIGVFTNVVTWRQSCGDGHTTLLNRGGRWWEGKIRAFIDHGLKLSL